MKYLSEGKQCQFYRFGLFLWIIENECLHEAKNFIGVYHIGPNQTELDRTKMEPNSIKLFHSKKNRP